MGVDQFCSAHYCLGGPGAAAPPTILQILISIGFLLPIFIGPPPPVMYITMARGGCDFLEVQLLVASG